MEIKTFLKTFFGDANDLSVENDHVAELAREAESEWPEAPIALPRTGDCRAPGLVRWYVFSPARSEDDRLGEELGAWIGPTYCASWTGRPGQLETRDPIDAAAAELTGGSVFIVDTAEKDRESVRANLAVLRELWRERPEERSRIPRRVSELLRDLGLSLTNGNPQTARTILDELGRRGLTTAENELFLEIAVLEAEGRWADIARHDRLQDLAARRRPWNVTRALLRSLYRTDLVESEQSEDLQPWIKRAGELEAELPGLFSTRGPIDAPEVAKLFALIDRSHPERPLRTRARVLDAPDLTEADRAFLEAVLDQSEAEAPSDPLMEARRLIHERDYDPAWDLVLDLENDPRRVEILIECAVELRTASAARAALEALRDLTPADSEDLIRSSRRLARDVRELEDSLVSPEGNSEGRERAESWEDWFRMLHSRESWPKAAIVAEKGAPEWTGEGALAGGESELAELVQHSRTAEQEREFLEAAPVLLGWLENLESGTAAVGLKQAFLEAVCLGDLRSEVALETALAIAESIIESGVGEAEYAEILANLEAVWASHASPRLLPWLSDCLEVLADLPKYADRLEGLAANMISASAPEIVKADAFTVAELEEAADSVGLAEDAVPKAQGGSPSEVWGDFAKRLDGKKVGLYTLSPQVGDRVKKKLDELAPGAVVSVNSDVKSTEKLRSLAKSADYMIVMLRSATHAATDAIAAARPKTAPTLRVGCRGSSGVLSAFLENPAAI